ncbi:hypothetical protein [Nocardioides sp. AE5]|uniref:hypothetical protein n=1 Tax=Nocardioides sp. AE5 TaxID=2962573 RepID=UPI0028824B16|nr:hypothetical protein [Nocardioides sp. AE5]MDT0201313.1 hypothetical protein [Nocardioides sp. AE5]
MAERLNLRDAALAAVLAVLALGPAILLPGYVLVGDMVFVPDQPWKSTWLGADGSVPRAVPSDAVISLLGWALPGSLVQKLVLFLTLFGAGLGAARLVGDRSQVARLAAMVLFVWNPFVYGRLAIGHWALLVGYAALPWVAKGARDLRAGTGAGWPGLALSLLVAAWSSPTGGVLAAGVALLFLLPSPRLLIGTLATVVLANLPWLVPGMVNSRVRVADGFGVDAFAARADTPWGVPGSVLGLGGMWKESIDAPGRGSLLLSGAGLAVVAAGLVGLFVLRRREHWTAIALSGATMLGLALALLPTFAAGEQVARWLVGEVPGGGLIRDSQKFVALVALAAAVGIAYGMDWLRERIAGAGPVPFVALAVLPVLVLPGLGWGLLGKFAPVQYPAEWEQVRSVMQEQGAEAQRTVVLPFSLYRRFDWNADKAVLDPAPRFFPGEVVIDDALVVRGGTVAGEDPLAARIRAAGDSPSALAAVLQEEGIAWALVHVEGPGDVTLPPGEVVHRGDRLALVRVGGDGPARTSQWAPAAVTASVVSALFGLAMFGMSLRRTWRAYTHGRENHQTRGGHG